MATSCHRIISQYEAPADEPQDDEKTWEAGPSFGPSRRIVHPPKFVAATATYDEYGLPQPQLESSADILTPKPTGATVGGLYTSLPSELKPTVQTSVSPNISIHPAPTPPSLPPSRAKPTTSRNQSKDWFISRALRSQDTTATPSPSFSMADLLSRAPPPLPSEKPFVPPVWVALGPGNKGYGMLQKNGWREGEGLGRAAGARPNRDEANSTDQTDSSIFVSHPPAALHKETVATSAPESSTQASPHISSHSAASEQRVLLTPLPTVLKSDRLGIGLKPRKRKVVTHSAAALAAHTREAQESKRLKMVLGRGSKGFARLHKAEERRRSELLADLKS